MSLSLISEMVVDDYNILRCRLDRCIILDLFDHFPGDALAALTPNFITSHSYIDEGAD